MRHNEAYSFVVVFLLAHPKHVVFEEPGKIVYEAQDPGHFVHYFTDMYRCEKTGKEAEILGKGAIVNRISALLYTRLHSLGISSHFSRALNMRKSLVMAAEALSVKTIARVSAMGDVARLYGLAEGTVFHRPLIEYYSTRGVPVSEGQILAFEWLSPDDLEEVHGFVSRVVDILRGFFLGIGFSLIEVDLSLGRLMTTESDDLVLIGDLSPETFCLQDVETHELVGKGLIASGEDLASPYKKVAQKLGIYLGGPQLSCILPFTKGKDEVAEE